MRILQLDLGPVPWSDLGNQPNLRFCDWRTVGQLSIPWVVSSLETMAANFPGEYRLDVRFWPELRAGFVPGAKVGWHVDITRLGGVHRLYTIGAGSRTEFRNSGQVPEEGLVVEYGTEEHRAREATYDGPRLMLRVTQPDERRAINQVGIPTWQHRA